MLTQKHVPNFHPIILASQFQMQRREKMLEMQRCKNQLSKSTEIHPMKITRRKKRSQTMKKKNKKEQKEENTLGNTCSPDFSAIKKIPLKHMGNKMKDIQINQQIISQKINKIEQQNLNQSVQAFPQLFTENKQQDSLMWFQVKQILNLQINSTKNSNNVKGKDKTFDKITQNSNEKLINLQRYKLRQADMKQIVQNKATKPYNIYQDIQTLQDQYNQAINDVRDQSNVFNNSLNFQLTEIKENLENQGTQNLMNNQLNNDSGQKYQNNEYKNMKRVLSKSLNNPIKKLAKSSSIAKNNDSVQLFKIRKRQFRTIQTSQNDMRFTVSEATPVFNAQNITLQHQLSPDLAPVTPTNFRTPNMLIQQNEIQRQQEAEK